MHSNTNISIQIAVVDPTKPETADLLKFIDSFVSNMAPVRVGVVLAVNNDQTLTGNDDAGIAILCAFNFIAEQHEGKEDANHKAMLFLSEVS